MTVQWCPSSRAEGHACERKLLCMNNPPAIQLRDYYVFATDIDADWRSMQLDVRASSRSSAEAIAYAALRKARAENWSVDLVIEVDPIERAEGDAAEERRKTEAA